MALTHTLSSLLLPATGLSFLLCGHTRFCSSHRVQAYFVYLSQGRVICVVSDPSLADTCPVKYLLLLPLLVPLLSMGDDWPQWLGPKRDGVWREKGIVERFDRQPKLRWSLPIGGGYAGPAVASGRVYVLDRQLAKGNRNPQNLFDKGKLQGTERILCLNES